MLRKEFNVMNLAAVTIIYRLFHVEQPLLNFYIANGEQEENITVPVF